MLQNFVYIVAVVDCFSRPDLLWTLSITMEVEFHLEAVEEALVRQGKLEIFDKGQAASSLRWNSLACCTKAV